nr:unnamed protein product [Digitaria exilis]
MSSRATALAKRSRMLTGKYSGENPQAAGVQPTNGSMVYLGGEQLATGAAASVAASSASRIIMAVALAAIVLV